MTMLGEDKPDGGISTDTKANNDARAESDVVAERSPNTNGNADSNNATAHTNADAEPEPEPENTGPDAESGDLEPDNAEPDQADPKDDEKDDEKNGENNEPEDTQPAGVQPESPKPENPEPESKEPEPSEPDSAAVPSNMEVDEPMSAPNQPEPDPEPQPEAQPEPSTRKPEATKPKPKPNPELDKRLPFGYWLMAGGTGPPPTVRNVLRMTGERNAVTREKEERAAALKEAVEKRKEYLANWEKEWGSSSAAVQATKGSRSKKGGK
ncbi:hypothetical protein F4677DRAFT_460227 [Hypoxylon crocopeplum]|nr:hypothetical protein F4677DRAFT_460227 [Hypoxylon crocopeplum]